MVKIGFLFCEQLVLESCIQARKSRRQRVICIFYSALQLLQSHTSDVPSQRTKAVFSVRGPLAFTGKNPRRWGSALTRSVAFISGSPWAGSVKFGWWWGGSWGWSCRWSGGLSSGFLLESRINPWEDSSELAAWWVVQLQMPVFRDHSHSQHF